MVELFAHLPPKLIHVLLRRRVAIYKIHARLEFVFLRHVSLGLERRDIRSFQAYHPVVALRRRRRSRGQTERYPADAHGSVGPKRKLCLAGKQLLTDYPM